MAKDKPKAEGKFRYLADKAPTNMHVLYQKWLLEEHGLEVDLKAVQIVCNTRDDFQTSPVMQRHRNERKAQIAAGLRNKLAKIEAKVVQDHAEDPPETPAAPKPKPPANRGSGKKPGSRPLKKPGPFAEEGSEQEAA